MKKYIIILFILSFIFFISFFYLNLEYKNENLNYPIKFFIKRGENYHTILSNLKQAGLIKNIYVFKIYNKLFPCAKYIKSGHYLINEPLPAIDILKMFIIGKIKLEKLTIPEGYNLRQIAKVLAEKFNIEYDSILNVLSSKDFAKKITNNKYQNLEGLLFPDTYKFDKDIDFKDLIKVMYNNFVKKTDPIWSKRHPHYRLSFYQTLILASIIQKETSDEKEYKIVSSVYHNRLSKGMRLQACPTVQYLLDKPKRLTNKELSIKSDYNTYLHKGLPPTPICSPGIDAFVAAIFPDSTDYLYFLADINGKHYFSKTFKEHNRMKQIIKRKLRNAKRRTNK